MMRSVVIKVFRSSALVCGVLFAPLVAPVPSHAAEFSAQDYEFFESKVRPVLAQHCFNCHGPKKQKADLKLDTRADFMRGSDLGPVVVPGKPDESRLLTAISYEDVDLQMPPRGKLPEGDIANIRKWIEDGAAWPEPKTAEPVEAAETEEAFDIAIRKDAHWAWQPISPADPPKVQKSDWVDNDVDRFVLAKLEANELSPAPSAEKATLLRRTYLDLIGMPPTPAEVDAFVADESEDAFAKIVDQLLASPRFGERWGRHWLDLMRYAESYGHEQDYPIHDAWRYRDYVIRAFNDDVPYDQFVREHIAGDLIEEPRINPDTKTNESILGTGFWFLGQATHAPVDVRQDEADRFDNMIDVMTKTFLGMTVACARCHDHKFDAISTADYYALVGFLQSSRRQSAFLDPDGRINEKYSAMSGLRESATSAFRDAVKSEADRIGTEFASLLKGSHEVMFGDWQPSDGIDYLKPNITFAQFEGDSFDGWFAEGGAFIRPQKVGEDGPMAASSYNGSDKPTGSLVSRPFVIERSLIDFQIAGGNHPGETEFQLRVDGEVARSETGHNSDNFRSARWDVSELAGKVAELALIDTHSEGWGHIIVDEIVFTEGHDNGEDRRPVDKVAQSLDLDSDDLKRMVGELRKAASDNEHPMRMWLELDGRGRELDPDSRKDRFAFLRERSALEKQSAEAAEKWEGENSYETFETFDGDEWGDWRTTGAAFGPGPEQGAVFTGPDVRRRVMPSGVASSAGVSRKFQGVLWSPTFMIEKDYIHYRVAGANVNVRVIVDGFVLAPFNRLLFDKTIFEVKTDGEFTWIKQDMIKYKGHRAWIEIHDEGDGWVAIDEIRFSDGDPPPAIVADAGAQAAIMGQKRPRTLGQLADAIGAGLAENLRGWAAGDAVPAEAMLAWAVRNKFVDLGSAGGAFAEVDMMLAATGKDVPGPIRAVAMLDGDPEDEQIFVRGTHKNAADVVHRRFLTALGGENQPMIEEGSGRMDLVDRLLADSNPLPSRVMVNRVWHHLMGRGIVPSADNFGVLGVEPSHPELLDHLATNFRSDWSVKNLIRRIVNSSTYKMSSRPQSEIAEAKDPDNRLLHRANIRRLEGEAIRDTILAVAGRFNDKMYGEPVPIHLTPFMDGRNRPESGPVDGEGRRSIYSSVRRNYLAPMMLTFDSPVPESTIGTRTVSNVPAQALMMMNDPFVVELAAHWGKQVAEKTDMHPWERIEHMFRKALGRSPSNDELYRAMNFTIAQGESYGLDPADFLDDERVWGDLAHVIFTLKEFTFVN